MTVYQKSLTISAIHLYEKTCAFNTQSANYYLCSLHIYTWAIDYTRGNIWASTRENLRSLISAFVIRLLDHILTCYEWNFIFLASLCSWAGWFEYHYVGNPEGRFSYVEAHIVLSQYRYFGFCHIGEQPRFRCTCAYANALQSLRCSKTWSTCTVKPL